MRLQTVGIHGIAATALAVAFLYAGATAADVFHLPLIHWWALMHGACCCVFPVYFMLAYLALWPAARALEPRGETRQSKKRQKLILAVTVLAIIFFLLSVGLARHLVGILNSRPDTDVTSSPEYNFTTFAGTVWKTKVKVGLADITSYKGRHEITLGAPESFDEADTKYTKLIDVLPVGTRLRIERLMQDNGSLGGVQVTASLEDGKVVYVLRELLAKNRFISPGWSDSRNWGMNPDMFEKAE